MKSKSLLFIFILFIVLIFITGCTPFSAQTEPKVFFSTWEEYFEFISASELSEDEIIKYCEENGFSKANISTRKDILKAKQIIAELPLPESANHRFSGFLFFPKRNFIRLFLESDNNPNLIIDIYSNHTLFKKIALSLNPKNQSVPSTNDHIAKLCKLNYHPTTYAAIVQNTYLEITIAASEADPLTVINELTFTTINNTK